MQQNQILNVDLRKISHCQFGNLTAEGIVEPDQSQQINQKMFVGAASWLAVSANGRRSNAGGWIGLELGGKVGGSAENLSTAPQLW